MSLQLFFKYAYLNRTRLQILKKHRPCFLSLNHFLHLLLEHKESINKYFLYIWKSHIFCQPSRISKIILTIICIYYIIVKLKEVFPEVLSSKFLRKRNNLYMKYGGHHALPAWCQNSGSNPKSWWKEWKGGDLNTRIHTCTTETKECKENISQGQVSLLPLIPVSLFKLIKFWYLTLWLGRVLRWPPKFVASREHILYNPSPWVWPEM